MLSDINKYGIRNNSIISEAPKENPSKMIDNNTSGCTPIMNEFHKIHSNLEEYLILYKNECNKNE